MNISEYVKNIGIAARSASYKILDATTQQKNDALNLIADNLEKSCSFLIKENEKDLSAGKRRGLDAALLDRLALNEDRIASMAAGLRQIANLPDPIGEISDLCYQPSGIRVGKMRVPLGVICIIYESRPNVTADAAGLCIKSGNTAILRGGSEAVFSNQAISQCIHTGLSEAGLSKDVVQVVEHTDRDIVSALVKLDRYVDVVVPRGGKGLIERISADSRVPVIKHLHGVCHLYIDDKADVEKSVRVAFNAKTQRYGTCNTMETLLVADKIASKVLPELSKLYLGKGVLLKGCVNTAKILPDIVEAVEDDWHTEYLAPVLSIKIVSGLKDAVDHIREYGSNHTDGIMTEDVSRADQFFRLVDSSSVMLNASTRFADGFEYGLGAEIGISTDKIHARGPVGINGLTSQKYVVYGDGHIRQ